MGQRRAAKYFWQAQSLAHFDLALTQRFRKTEVETLTFRFVVGRNNWLKQGSASLFSGPSIKSFMSESMVRWAHSTCASFLVGTDRSDWTVDLDICFEDLFERSSVYWQADLFQRVTIWIASAVCELIVNQSRGLTLSAERSAQ